MNFTKMHGIGNDYVYVNCFAEQVDNPSQTAIEVSDRHFGIGSDGLILICPSEKADVRMRMFNADGSESQMCGNGIRCVAKYAYDHKLASAKAKFVLPNGYEFAKSLRVETKRGILAVGLDIDKDDKVLRVCVNMGYPILKPEDIPANFDGETVIEKPFGIGDFACPITCVSMGNPHAVFFCDDIDSFDWAKVGSLVEKHPKFPQRVNAHFVKVIGKGEFVMKTWERGSGITLACGTGACACAVAAVLTKRCDGNRNIIAHLPGGDLELCWFDNDNCVYMTGPAVEVFSGLWH